MKAFTITNTGSEAFLVEESPYGTLEDTKHILQPGASLKFRPPTEREWSYKAPRFFINVRDELRNVTQAVSAAEQGEDK